ncbi:hypothetical protein BH11MYX4_BH11MYX4_10610 [soil metagenome]
MRNTFRYGLASIIVAGTALGATVVACGDDDSGSGSSSGTVPEASTTDSPAGDSSLPDAADAAKPNFAKLTFINATTDLGDGKAPAESATSLNGRGDTAIRICFKQGTTAQNLGVAPYPPLPDKPKGTQPVAGVLPGTGGTFPSFGLDLEGRIIVPIVMNVKTLVAKQVVNPGNGQPGTTCDELVGDTADAAAGLVENQDYWVLPQIDAGTFKKEKSYVLALTGCRGDSVLNPGKECGPGFTAGGGAGLGNLKVQIFETNTTPVSATQLGVQVFHLSAQADALFGAASGNPFPITPGFVTNPDGGVGFRAASAAPLELNKLTPVMGVTGVKDSDLFVLNKTSPSLDPIAASKSLVPFPLPFIQALSGLGLPTAPTVYKDGANYVFVAIGDPTQPTFSATNGTGPGDGGDGTVFNTRSVHYLAFPTDPVIEPYKP